MAKSAAERLQGIEQQKARIAQQEAKLKLDARKARDRRLYAAGGLVEKAGLLDLDNNALYGALLSLKDAATGKDQVEQWAAIGGRSFAREARLRDEGKEPITLTFPAPLSKDVTASLRAASASCSNIGRGWRDRMTPRRSQSRTPAPFVASTCRPMPRRS
jgi:hypothetical protein